MDLYDEMMSRFDKRSSLDDTEPDVEFGEDPEPDPEPEEDLTEFEI